jgi:uncharacterized protein YecE (DUF72 family)
MVDALGEVRVGISGWRYAPWRGKFYPPSLPQREELAYASRQIDSIEINGSFYSLQRPESYLAWYDATPEKFVFAVKGPRYVTHMRRLADVRTPLANFLASGVLALRRKLGPILWQFPPNFPWDEDRFESFFDLLPRDTDAALATARDHDQRVADRSWVTTTAKSQLRHAVEIRHRSFAQPAFVAQLRRHRIALVVADTAGHWPMVEDLTADFVYIRLHGDRQLYASGYGDTAMAHWAERIFKWRRGEQPGDARLVSAVAPTLLARRGSIDARALKRVWRSSVDPRLRVIDRLLNAVAHRSVALSHAHGNVAGHRHAPVDAGHGRHTRAGRRMSRISESVQPSICQGAHALPEAVSPCVAATRESATHREALVLATATLIEGTSMQNSDIMQTPLQPFIKLTQSNMELLTRFSRPLDTMPDAQASVQRDAAAFNLAHSNAVGQLIQGMLENYANFLADLGAATVNLMAQGRATLHDAVEVSEATAEAAAGPTRRSR